MVQGHFRCEESGYFADFQSAQNTRLNWFSEERSIGHGVL
jgi:hypothetical protein